MDHSYRVSGIVEKLLRKIESSKITLSKEIIISAGMLHDIGDLKRVKGNTIDYDMQIDHAVCGAELAEELLIQNGVEQKSASAIATIIKHHHNYKYSGAYGKEIFIVQDADTIDELGIINFWQMFQYSGAIGRDLSATVKYWEKNGFERKNNCVNKCHFDFSRTIAEKRLAEMNGFMKKVKGEYELRDVR